MDDWVVWSVRHGTDSRVVILQVWTIWSDRAVGRKFGPSPIASRALAECVFSMADPPMGWLELCEFCNSSFDSSLLG